LSKPDDYNDLSESIPAGHFFCARDFRLNQAETVSAATVARHKLNGDELRMVELTNEIIDYQTLTEQIRSNQAGAVVLFLGTVREMTAGRQTLALDYDAFHEMAIARMEELETEVRQRWPVTNVGIIHRLGHLELGEISVAVAVSSPHRELAFEAGKYLIDTLKITVPVWKKENWSDGTTEWVHPGTGEPMADAPDTKSLNH